MACYNWTPRHSVFTILVLLVKRYWLNRERINCLSNRTEGSEFEKSREELEICQKGDFWRNFNTHTALGKIASLLNASRLGVPQLNMS